MAGLKVKATSSSKLLSMPVEDGSLIFVQDSPTIAFDIQGVRQLYTNIKRIKTSDKDKVILSGFYFTTDTQILWSFEKGVWTQITSSPSEDKGIIPIDGTIGSNVIISQLDNGIYSVGGQYRIIPNGGVNITLGRDIFVVSGQNVHQIDGKEITQYVIVEDEIESTNKYITDADFSQYIKRDEAKAIIQEMISMGLEKDVLEIIEHSLATESDIEHIFDV